MSASSTTEGGPGEPARRQRGQRWLAALWGLGCHGTFAVAVSSMFLGLADGLRPGHGTLSGRWGLAGNTVLALQFPLLHSFLLTRRGRALLTRFVPLGKGRDLAPTSYAWIAALQILATFTLWSPSGRVWMEPAGSARAAAFALFLAAWAYLGKALLDGGLGLQTGWIGWTAVWRDRSVRFPPLARTGLFATCRQPIYLGFALTLWTGPVWTPDRLLLALVWTGYCVVGPLHKERRYLRLYGPAFQEYQRAVPYMLPWKRGRA